jgi:fructose-specific phosphotransferase system IIA component
MKKKEFLKTFEEELFVPDFKADNKHEALKALVDFLYSQKRVNNHQAVLNTILERERLGSTGLGKGVAIPHSRSMMVDRLTVVFGRFKDGLDFEARDGKPVHLVFLILAPPQDVGNQYLPFLGKLVEVFKEKRNRDRLKKVESFEEYMEVMEAVV